MTDLTLTEQRHVRTALRVLRTRMGGGCAVGKALHCVYSTLDKVCNQRRTVTARMAVRVARLVDMPVDDLLAGKFVPEGTCPHCGHAPDFTEEATIVDGAPVINR